MHALRCHALLALTAALLIAAPAAPRSPADAPPPMSVDELRRGMRGQGRTVFQGTAVDTFGVEILGVMRHGLGPRQDMILARLSGGPLAQTGVIRGMSGSPVYVDGRLIGAVAYGWSYSTLPICGITPIHQMLGVLERGLDAPPDGDSGAGAVRLDPIPASWVCGSLNDPDGPAGTGSERLALEPLGLPVWVSGLSPASADAVRELLAPFGLQVLAGPGQDDRTPTPDLEPGAALGVQLISGDMSATGIGTLTWREGDRVLAFGHPMMLAGTTDLPLTGAVIYDIIPNQVSSFKMGAATRPVGAVRQDRTPGLAGMLGAAPAMLPVAVEVTASGQRASYAFGVVRQRELLPGLALATVLSALEASEKLFGDATLRLSSELRLVDGRSVRREQAYSGPLAITQAAREAVIPVATLCASDFAGTEIDSLRFSLQVAEGIHAARIAGLRVDRREVAPGDTLEVQVTLEPYQLAPQVRRLTLAVPRDVPDGVLRLRAGNGRASEEWERQRRPDSVRPRDLDQLLAALAEVRRDDELVLELYRSAAGLTVDGRELPALPPSARAVLASGSSVGHVGTVSGPVVARLRAPTDWVLSGEQSLELTLRRARR